MSGYMTTSTPVARDIVHPEFAAFCKRLSHPLVIHRKMWEWAFIYENLKRAGVLRPGNRGLVFGVGQEQLPALFAGLGAEIVATDAVVDKQEWTAKGGHYAQSVEPLFFERHIDRPTFDRRVRFEPCDMNSIAPHLRGFDFCWSSCSLEHLGSLKHGLDFIINSVETLKIGGVACHTTELNLSSNLDTIEHHDIAFYRLKDIAQLHATLAERGHVVEPLRIEWGDLPADDFIDEFSEGTYPQVVHLKLRWGHYIMTSLGLVVRRGR
jgi:hypothetical protein